MAAYIAFLRAINVGGRFLKMEALREHLAPLGYENLTTFIQSGNVIFSTGRTDVPTLEAEIEARLREALGYDVATFIRTPEELSALIQTTTFTHPTLSEGAHAYIGFLKTPLLTAQQEKLDVFCNEIDAVFSVDRELHWIAQKHKGDAGLTGGKIEKKTKAAATFRNITTVQKLAEMTRI